MTATIVLFAILAAHKKPAANPQQSLLDQYLQEAETHQSQETTQSLPGAIWSPAARLDESGRDVRATQVNDVVTILVTESVNAVASGASSTERQSSANQSITNLAGIRSPAGALVNMLGASGDQKLNGTGTTSRASTLTATLTARVVRVLPGGLLLVEGEKNIQVNAERQQITVRGIIRPVDLSTANTVLSTQVADMEIRVNGQGIVSDAVRRPNFFYRLLLGLLPF